MKKIEYFLHQTIDKLKNSIYNRFIHKSGEVMDFLQDDELTLLLAEVKEGSKRDEAFAKLAQYYEPMMRSRVVPVFAGTADVSEAMQEAHIALHSAALTYNAEKCRGVTFGLYAGICVCNRLKSLLRKKQRELAHAEQFTSGEELGALSGVESFLVTRDLCERVMKAAASVLSEFEFQVFRLSFEGYATRDIAKRLGRTPKAVDNAKARISRRLKDRSDIRMILSDI